VTAPAAPAQFPYVPLLTLAGAIFVSVTSEFLPTGLLPDMARDLEVSLSTVGLLISIFAGTVVVATTPLALITQRYSRKRLVVIVLGVIALANVLAGLAPTYEILVGARVLGGLGHGLFWAVVTAYAAHLVPKHQLGKATAITAGGGSAAFVLGVPVGTALGHAFGWRSAFIIIGVVVVVLAVVVLRFLPPIDHRVPLRTGEIPVPARRDRSLPSVLVLCGIILLILTGQNLYATYIAPWFLDVAGFEADSVPILLFLFGGAGVVGLVLAGFAADRFPRRGFAVAVGAVALSFAVLPLVSGNGAVVVIAYVVWGVAFGAVPAMLQTRMIHTASFRLRGLAAALQTTAFNLGIGAGALVGALVLERVGIAAVPWFGFALITLGLIAALSTNSWMARRAAHSRT
jgi:predicted MFS family arabinose efflux permease